MKLTLAAFAAILLSVAVSGPASACTGIMLRADDGSTVHGRTLEFGMTIDTSLAFVPRGYRFTGQTPRGDGLRYSAKYASVGIIAFNEVTLLDGLNEKGLAVGTSIFRRLPSIRRRLAQTGRKPCRPAIFPTGC